MDNNFNMTFEESQNYIAKRRFDIPWNDCDVFIVEREIIRTVGNVLKWADKTMIEKACEWIEDNVENAFVCVNDTITELNGIELSRYIRKAMEE